jgi:hypothetical protein
MKKQFPEIWFRGLQEKEKVELHKWLSTSHLVERLRDIVKSYEREAEIPKADYDNPAWAYKQAHHNGERHAYAKILKLLGEHEDNLDQR